MEKTSVITLNGNTYHAITGALVTSARAKRTPVSSHATRIGVTTAAEDALATPITVKQYARTVNSSRLQRAAATPKHTKISRFGRSAAPFVSGIPINYVPIPVQEPPRAAAHTPPHRTQQAQPDMFEHAIAAATNFVDVKAHVAAYRQKAQAHAVSMAAGVFAIAFLSLFAWYQASPRLQMQVAGAQAGVSAAIPRLQQAGLAYAGVTVDEGKRIVTLNGSHGTQYRLIQQPTNWSERDLIDHIAATDASGTPNYTTVPMGDTTVYRFGDTMATWVTRGTWHQLTGSAPLSGAQLTALVKNN